MFFDSANEIASIASKIGCGVFVMPADTKVEIKHALTLAPEDKSTITIDQVRDVTRLLNVRHKEEMFVVIRPADKLGEEAENALLKNLEEPGERVHFVLITEQPSKLLPTVLSRAAVYFLQSHAAIDGDIAADAKTKDLAKRLIVAKPGDLVGLAEEITKKKDGVRSHALTVLAVTIEMLYKSYYKTGKMAFLTKIPKFLAAYENIERNGNIKLQLVAALA